MSSRTETFDALIENVEGRAPSDRLMIMAQNPAHNHHWSLGLATVTAHELLTVLKVGRAAMAIVEAAGIADAPTLGTEPLGEVNQRPSPTPKGGV